MRRGRRLRGRRGFSLRGDDRHGLRSRLPLRGRQGLRRHRRALGFGRHGRLGSGDVGPDEARLRIDQRPPPKGLAHRRLHGGTNILAVEHLGHERRALGQVDQKPMSVILERGRCREEGSAWWVRSHEAVHNLTPPALQLPPVGDGRRCGSCLLLWLDGSAWGLRLLRGTCARCLIRL